MAGKDSDEEQLNSTSLNNENEEPSSDSSEIRCVTTKSHRDNAVTRDSSDLVTARPKWSFLRNEDLLGQHYEEYAHVPSRRAHSRVSWDHIKQIQEIPHLGHKRTYEKRGDRSRPNPWRRYGALVKLHEIGGWASKIDRQQSCRRNRKYYYVKPGSRPCNPPTRPPITVRESKFLPASAITIPRCESVDQIASSIGMQFQMLLRKHSREKRNSPLNVDTAADSEKIQSAPSFTSSPQDNGAFVEQPSANSKQDNSTNKLPTRWSSEGRQRMLGSEIQVETAERAGSSGISYTLSSSKSTRLQPNDNKRCGMLTRKRR